MTMGSSSTSFPEEFTDDCVRSIIGFDFYSELNIFTLDLVYSADLNYPVKTNKT